MFLCFLPASEFKPINDVVFRIEFALALPNELTIPPETGLDPALAASANAVDHAGHELAQSTALKVTGSVLP